MRDFEIIVALDEKGGIGRNGVLAWHLPSDLKHFKAITTSVEDPDCRNAVIMGRKSWDSLPVPFRPLPGRLNVIISRSKDIDLPEGVLSATGLEEALKILGAPPHAHQVERVFVIGGAQIYALAINHPRCRVLHLTRLHQTFPCDVFFPPIPEDFREVSCGSQLEENGFSFHFLELRRP